MLPNFKWNEEFAYAIGLITTDGSLSKDGRHIDFTSKDYDQVENFIKILKLQNKIGMKYARADKAVTYYRVQFGDIKLYKFLLKIGLTPNKSKTLGKIKIPNKYFIDFLRGCLDGDGFTYSYWDSIWKNSFRLYTGFVSASFKHLEWMNGHIYKLYGIKGKIGVANTAYQLKFAKSSSIVLLNKLYYKTDLICLTRKRMKIQLSLSIIINHSDMARIAPQ